MPRFIVDLGLDGYESKEEEIKACEIFIREQLEVAYGLEVEYVSKTIEVEPLEN